jgi:RsiW-degrading membrane proteinase PrsW (M82 family)
MSIYDRLLAITGIIPPFLLMWLAESFERRVKEPTQGWRYRVLFAAGLTTIPLAWIERFAGAVADTAQEPVHTLLESYLVAGAIEECGKFAVLLLLTRGALGPRTRYGAFLYALHASMGFALVENVVAMLKTPDMVAFSTRFFLRAYMTVPMHLVAGGVLGYFWAHRRFDAGALGIAGGTGLAIAIHGSFNSALLAVERLPDTYERLRIACAVSALLIPLGGLLLLRVLAGRLRDQDRRDGEAAPDPGRRGRSSDRAPAA